MGVESSDPDDERCPGRLSNSPDRTFEIRRLEDGAAMTRTTTPLGDLELIAAVGAAAAALSDVARYTGAGLRTVVRRAGHAGTDLSRRTWIDALESGRRANLALRVYRGQERITRRRPAEYLVAGVVAGATGTLVFAVLTRSVLLRAGDPPDTPERHGAKSDGAKSGGANSGGADSARPLIDRVVSRRTPRASRPLALLKRTEDLDVPSTSTADPDRSTAVHAGHAQGGQQSEPFGVGSPDRRV
jgi:hypothetical protein